MEVAFTSISKQDCQQKPLLKTAINTFKGKKVLYVHILLHILYTHTKLEVKNEQKQHWEGKEMAKG